MNSYFLLHQSCVLNQTRAARRIPALAACLLVMAIPGCGKPAPAPTPPVPVKTMILAAEEIIVSSQFSGSVEPLQSTSLAFKLPGTVQRLYRAQGVDRDVQVGDTLAKGTVIAELDEGDLRRAKASAQARVDQLEARVATARENLAIATRNYERFVQSSGSVSETVRDDTDARRVAADGELASAAHALAEARVTLDQANDNYINRQLIVPFDHATVSDKSIEPGERKAAHEVAFRLIDISTVHINFGVPDTMVGEPGIDPNSSERVFLGQKLAIMADALEGRTLVATVTKIAPQADPKTRTFLTQLSLANQEIAPGQPLLRPGMIVTVRVGAENNRQVILVPMAAIHQGQTPDEMIVYEAVNEKGIDIARSRKVTLGGVYNNQIEILPHGSQVQAGSRIITTTAERLTDGLAIRVMQDDNHSATTRTEGNK